jgi:hypothetical protein
MLRRRWLGDAAMAMRQESMLSAALSMANGHRSADALVGAAEVVSEAHIALDAACGMCSRAFPIPPLRLQENLRGRQRASDA